MTNFLTEQEFAIAMAVVSTATMMMGFVLGFSLCYLEKELVLGEVHELLDKAIEKKFERDQYVFQLEATIDEIQRANAKMATTMEIPAYHPVLKRKRTNTTGVSSDEEDIQNYPPILRNIMSEETRIELEKNKEMMNVATLTPPNGPIERCIARGISDGSTKEPIKED